jgi:hypothetical protein
MWRMLASGARCAISAGLLALFLLSGCGGAASARPAATGVTAPEDQEPLPRSEPPPAEAASTGASSEPGAAGDTPQGTAATNTTDTTAGSRPAAAAADPTAPREVKYVLTPEGLKIEVAGVRFLASAETKQVGQGWGVKVNVKAEAADGKEHVLLSPKHGPLAFAAAVVKKGESEAERSVDEREGEDDKKIAPGAPLTFSRDFPSKGGRALAIGDTLDLDVGLWGVGESADNRRPVKQFFHVRMKVDKGKPKPIVEPPASAK